MQSVKTKNTSSKRIAKRYSQIEDGVIIQCVKDSPDNMTRAFESASKKLRGRSPGGISQRWRTTLKDKHSNVFNTRSSNKVTDNIKNDVRLHSTSEGLVIPVTFEMAKSVIDQLSSEERSKLFSRYIS